MSVSPEMIMQDSEINKCHDHQTKYNPMYGASLGTSHPTNTYDWNTH